MRPSERIVQIEHERTYFDGNTNRQDFSVEARIRSIKMYLDEIWEEKQIALKKLKEDLKD